MKCRTAVDVLRVLALACAAVLLSAHAPAPSAKASPIETLDAHRGASALFRDGDLWVSVAQKWHRPSAIRMSRGRGPIERTLRGYLAGVHRGRALVAVPSGAQLAIQSVGLTGDPIILGRIPRTNFPGSTQSLFAPTYRYAVTSTGEVVAAPRATFRADVVSVIGERTRAYPIMEAGEASVSMASDPRAPRIALVLDHCPYFCCDVRSPARGGGRILVFDARTGAVLQDRALGRNLRADEGEAAFDATGALWVHLHDRFLRIDAEGERAVLRGVSIDALRGVSIDERNLVLAADGSSIAYTESYRAGPECRVYSLRTDAHRSHRMLRTDYGDCHFGLGMTFVGHTLWVAPP